jgi:RNA polymerase sigma factor (sigma-70 family)
MGNLPRASWTDERLVRECLDGNQEAWSALIDKYKNLIFSVPLRYGLSREDAADVFQAVCVDLLTELPRLREPKALAGWLIRITAHRSLRWKRGQRNLDPIATEPPELLAAAETVPGVLLVELEREQAVRQAVRQLPPRCRQLVHLLFFASPSWTYQQIGERLGLATGSIGFIRGRCLSKLRRQLRQAGFR